MIPNHLMLQLPAYLGVTKTKTWRLKPIINHSCHKHSLCT